MAIQWTDSSSVTVPIVWQEVDALCDVATDKELVGIRVSVVNEVGDMYFDDIELFKNMTLDRLVANNVTNIPLTNITAGFERPVLAAFGDIELISAHIVLSGNSAASGTLRIKAKMASNNDICTKTLASGSPVTSYTQVDFGPVNDYALLSEGDVVSFTSDVTLPDALLILQWNTR